MKVVNRGLVLILPKAPFLSWVQELLGADAPMTLGELRQDATALLITEFEDDRAGKRCIRVLVGSLCIGLASWSIYWSLLLWLWSQPGY